MKLTDFGWLTRLHPAFVSILDEMRYGRLSKKTVAVLSSLKREIKYEDGIAPTELSVRVYAVFEDLRTTDYLLCL